jgi:hypothetical protein
MRLAIPEELDLKVIPDSGQTLDLSGFNPVNSLNKLFVAEGPAKLAVSESGRARSWINLRFGTSNGFALQLRGHDGRRDERAQI